jgi:pimeloyl-ACP methyl ester carboxylesterase
MGRAPSPRLEGAVRLSDGRRIGIAEYGDPRGDAVLWFHGTPGASRQVPPAAIEMGARRGVRLVAIDRPGIGISTPHVHMDVLASSGDVGELLDRLGIDRFACIALSGGGPYLLACAAQHAERMVAGAVLGGVAPARGPEAVPGGLVGLLAPFAPALEVARAPLGRALWAVVRVLAPAHPLVFEAYIRTSPAGDQEVFRRPEMRAMFLDDILHGSRRQACAPIIDVVLFSREWGFSLRDLTVPIHFWHGDSDHIVPLTHAEHMASLVPGATLQVRPGESHLGSLGAADEVIDAVLAHWHGDPRTLRTGAAPRNDGLGFLDVFDDHARDVVD